VIGYGRLPNFTEYDSNGHVLLDATLGRNIENYRTYLAPWSGHPTTRPAIAAQTSATHTTTIEVSWNGATSDVSARSGRTTMTAVTHPAASPGIAPSASGPLDAV
jgi:hypothetical protein